MKHPIHPMIVHFPIACWSIATGIDITSQFIDLKQFNIAGILILFGIVLALPAMVSGLIDMVKIANESPAIAVVMKHMSFISLAWLCYALSFYMRFDNMEILLPNNLSVVLSVSGFIFLSIAGWYGGNLVYRYNIGRVE